MVVRLRVTHTSRVQNRREQDVFLAQLIKDGENPNPPAK
jgi:hypothetical protein